MLEVPLISASISSISLAVATFAFLLSRRNAIAARCPIVVFEYTDSVGWRVRNVGNGPAVNLQVSVRGKKTQWSEAVLVPCLPTGETFDLTWIGHLNAWMLGGEYSDYLGMRYNDC